MARPKGIPVWKVIGVAPPPPAGTLDRKPIVIVGGGPVGMAMALDLGRRGHDIVVVTRWDFLPAYSKAICWSKRSLDILDRLGVGQRLVDKGVIWNVGKVFRGDDKKPVYEFDMQPVKSQKRPGFINLQQYYAEEYLHDAVNALDNIDFRAGHEVTGVRQEEDGVVINISCGDVDYEIRTDWLIACDGNKSSVRELMGLDFEGRVFEDNFLIADITMKEERPSERWFWFDPPFNPGQSVLLHKQPDDMWRIDFQIGWNIDREAVTRDENVEPRIRAMLGEDVQFQKEWYSVYTFQCRRMARFLHGRVIFAGDAAHLVSPFGARGCNGGFADIDNLGWKLDLVIRGDAPACLLESYDYEAIVTADENILNSTRSTDFLTPKSAVSAAFRDAALTLAADHPLARPLVNSGRLSTAVAYPDSPLNTKDEDRWYVGVRPGCPPLDAPLGEGWLLDRLGRGFTVLANGVQGASPGGVNLIDVSTQSGLSVLIDRYDLEPGSAYLFRPDQYVAARWREPTTEKIMAALNRAKGM
ncbi:MAG: FAD-dependent oxidoreductase [Parvularculaceae bacterium]|jgi:3-(3-hydroxy-phenyl)propionate hydroxylase